MDVNAPRTYHHRLKDRQIKSHRVKKRASTESGRIKRQLCIVCLINIYMHAISGPTGRWAPMPLMTDHVSGLGGCWYSSVHAPKHPEPPVLSSSDGGAHISSLTGFQHHNTWTLQFVSITSWFWGKKLLILVFYSMELSPREVKCSTHDLHIENIFC